MAETKHQHGELRLLSSAAQHNPIEIVFRQTNPHFKLPST